MPNTLEAISKSLSNDVRTLGAISHNVANINTPGFRGVRSIQDFGDSAGLRSSLDQRDGALSQTGRSYDVALRGPGFFVVDRQGTALLVRSGAFRIDAEGALATANGDRLVGPSGPIDAAASLRIDPRGGLWSGEQNLGQLQIVTVADASRLRALDGGAYAYDGELGEWSGSVVQGALEQANVDAAEETVRLMETTRHAESVQRAISIYDKAMDTGINRLGDN